jgi:sugar phosphate isomerase/epimerase
MGFRAVQLSAAQPGLRPRELDRSGRRELLARLRMLRLPAAGLDLWIPPGHFVDPAWVDRAVATVAGAVELAADLGRCPVSLAFPGLDLASGPIPIVEAISEHALRFGVRLADHAVPPAIASPDAAPSPSLGAGIDPAAWLGRGEDPVAAVAKYARHLVTVRVCEDPRLDVEAYRQALGTAGYRGPVVVDLRRSAQPWRALGELSDPGFHF